MNWLVYSLFNKAVTLSEETTSDELRPILAPCPNLVNLSIGRSGESVESIIIEAYESRHCKVVNLYIGGFWKADDSPSMDFIRMLQHPESTATKTLRSLVLLEP